MRFLFWVNLPFSSFASSQFGRSFFVFFFFPFCFLSSHNENWKKWDRIVAGRFVGRSEYCTTKLKFKHFSFTGRVHSKLWLMPFRLYARIYLLWNSIDYIQIIVIIAFRCRSYHRGFTVKCVCVCMLVHRAHTITHSSTIWWLEWSETNPFLKNNVQLM